MKYSIQPIEAAGFSTFGIHRLHHDFHRHPLLQLDALAQLARELMPRHQCRFVDPGITQDSKFFHVDAQVDGRDIDAVFEHIEAPGSWIALYNIEAISRYRVLLNEIVDAMRATVEREQPGIFNITGFVFISAPPSVTPFHIDRENNFWLQLHGRKVLSVWDAADRMAVPAEAVEDFIVRHTSKDVRLTQDALASVHEFDSGPGDGVYFPTTSPHMTRSDRNWVTPGEGVSISLGVTFYTRHTRRLARVHQWNRACRKYLRMSPRHPGMCTRIDGLKAPAGWLVAGMRQALLRQLHALRGLLRGTRPDDGWWGERPPPGSY